MFCCTTYRNRCSTITAYRCHERPPPTDKQQPRHQLILAYLNILNIKEELVG
jgi:hypothetical protein